MLELAVTIACVVILIIVFVDYYSSSRDREK